MIYTLVLSNKEEVKISEAEFNYFKENMSSNFIQLENGIINPSFVVSVLIDEDETYKDNIRRMNLIGKNQMAEEDYENLRIGIYNKDRKGLSHISQLLDKYNNKLLK